MHLETTQIYNYHLAIENSTNVSNYLSTYIDIECELFANKHNCKFILYLENIPYLLLDLLNFESQLWPQFENEKK